MRPNIKSLVVLALSSFAAMWPASASAGSVSGPFVLWMNLAKDASADEALHAYTHAEPDADSCWNESALLLYREFSADITPELVQRAVLGRDGDSRETLKRLLRKGDSDIQYDGIVIVPSEAHRRLVSFSAAGRIKSRPVVTAAGHPDWPTAFCAVLPPISRKP